MAISTAVPFSSLKLENECQEAHRLCSRGLHSPTISTPTISTHSPTISTPSSLSGTHTPNIDGSGSDSDCNGEPRRRTSKVGAELASCVKASLQHHDHILAAASPQADECTLRPGAVTEAPKTTAVPEEDECLHAQLRWLQRELADAQAERDVLQKECENVMVARAETERCLYYAFLEVKTLRSQHHSARPTRDELKAMMEPVQLQEAKVKRSCQLRLEDAGEKQCLRAHLEDLEHELVVTLVERDEFEAERNKLQSALDDAERSLQEAFKEVTALRA